MAHQSEKSRRVAFAAITLGALLAGCSSAATTSGGSTTVDTSTSASASTSATTTTATTTAATDTTVPAAATTVVPEPLTLREDGLGPFDFGSAPGLVIDAVTVQLGAFASSEVATYEVLEGDLYRDFDSGTGLALPHPIGKTTCWAGEFCAEFGGASEAEMTFIGWWYSGPPHMLASSSNLTISAKWGDFPSMNVFATCYRTGGGTHHGIYLVLTVDGGWDWLVSDGAGNFVETLPDPELTRVTFMSAGVSPFEPSADC